MTISVLIPVKGDNKNLRECVEACLQLDYPDFEIIVLPDAPINLPYGDKIRIIPTGDIGPAKKRDMVIKDIKGEILAFIDDDAYPRKDWLKNAASHFKDENVAAVCGPAVTPAADTSWQKASGGVYASFLVSGPHNKRYIPKQQCEVDDYPSCNFLVRRDLFEEVGGFDTNFWPGEDTVLCLKITKELKKRIIYDPNILAYHHRRPLFIPHLKQIRSYALHRGYFVKRFPSTSFRLSYFMPTLFVLGLIGGGLLSMISQTMKFFYFGVITIYLFLALLASIRGQFPLGTVPLTFAGIVLTHITYGIYFIKGLFSKKLSDEQ